MIKRELYFGSHPNLDCFTKVHIDWFFKNEVPYMLGDCTIYDAVGCYLNMKELTKVVTVIYEDGDIQYEKKIEELCELYKERFEQESILVVESIVTAREI